MQLLSSVCNTWFPVLGVKQSGITHTTFVLLCLFEFLFVYFLVLTDAHPFWLGCYFLPSFNSLGSCEYCEDPSF
jgi:hypothetical protein